MADSLHCWRCGADLKDLSLPLSRLDECPECTVYIHVCRMCSHFDVAVSRACREDDAEEVQEKERANFCDYFTPSSQAFDTGIATADRKARTQLDGLFGGASRAADPDSDDEIGKVADDLFK